MTNSYANRIRDVKGTGVFVPGDDLDTDQIIPAEYLKCLTFEGLGDFAFYNARFDESGEPSEHPLNDDRFMGSSILLSGRNFGCGSSREHAPQSLYRAGFRAIIAESFAEIFMGNCVALGLVCVSASRSNLEKLGALIQKQPTLPISVSLDLCRVSTPSLHFTCSISTTARDAFRGGYWDPLTELLEEPASVQSTFENLPYQEWTT